MFELEVFDFNLGGIVSYKGPLLQAHLLRVQLYMYAGE